MRILSVLSLSSVLLLAGCSLSPTAKPTAVTGGTLVGKAFGGQQPIKNASVYLLAVINYNDPNYATTNTSMHLLNSSVATNNPGHYGQDTNGNYYVTTDSNGVFNLTGDYTCTAGDAVYALLQGGNSGSGDGTQPNPAIELISILGTCPADGDFSTTIPFLNINEVTTVAAAYVMTPYGQDPANLTYSGTTLGKSDLQRSFANFSNLVDVGTGAARTATLNGNGVVPQQKINTIANILAGCVNSANGSSAACQRIANDISAYGSGPGNTGQAALYLATNPYPGSAQISDLFTNTTPQAPFSPALPNSVSDPTPQDFALAIRFPGSTSGINFPIALAADGQGRIWVANFSGSSVAVLDGMGKPVTDSPFTGGGNIHQPFSIAIDTLGDAWIGSFVATNGIVKLLPTGAPDPASPLASVDSSSSHSFESIVVDGTGSVNNIWTHTENRLYKYAVSGTLLGQYNPGSMNDAAGMSLDMNSQLYIGQPGSSNSSAQISVISTGDGSEKSGSPISLFSTVHGSYALGVDGFNNLWVGNSASGANSVTYIQTDPTNVANDVADSGSPYAIGGAPIGLVVDGFGRAWLALSTKGVARGVNSNSFPFTMPSGGFGLDEGMNPRAVAVDGGGNVWVADISTASNANGNLIEFVGLGAPTVTPTAAAMAAPYLAAISTP